MEKVLKTEIFATIPQIDEAMVNKEIAKALQCFNKKIIVLDDEPTGIQTVHGISVYTDWSRENIEAGFNEANSMFFILTNSRSFTEKETAKAHQEMAAAISEIAHKVGKDFIVISRGDSTLRGHYPLETKVLKDTFEKDGAKIDGEVLMPIFKEGGRFTIGNIHYVQEGDYLTPVLCVAIGAGGVGLSHVNDSGFWIVKEYYGMTVQDTFKTWTLATTIASVVALAGALIFSTVL